MLKPMDRWAEPPIMEGPKRDGASGTSPSPGLSVGLLCRNGYVQRFRIVWIPTHFGRHRAILVCSSCGGGAIRLFGHYGNYACRYCHRAAYASLKYNQFGRKRLAASKLRLQLGGPPDITEPLPPKPKWTRRRTYQRIRNEIQALEAKAKTHRFKKPLSSQLFAYHIG